MSRRPRLLVVAPNWLGDLVMSTSLLASLAAPEEGKAPPEIHVAVRDRWASLLAGDPRVGELLIYEREGAHAGWRGALRLARQWRDGGYDAVFVLPPSWRAAAVARLAGIPRRLGFHGEQRGFLLTDALPRPPRCSLHYTEELALLARAWRGGVGPAPPPSLAIGAVPAAGPDVPPGPPVWIVSVGTTYGDAKSWPPAAVAGFVGLAVAEAGARVVLIGDPPARSMAERVRAACDDAGSGVSWSASLAATPGCCDLVGRTDLPGLVALLRGADLFVGNDSGPMHLAAALGTPTVGIFGSSSPIWTGPRGARTTVVAVEGFRCHPCFLRACPKPLFCLETITPRRVMAAARSLFPGLDTGEVGIWKPLGVTEPQPARPTLFLDRDGVVIHDGDYLRDPRAVALTAGAGAALRKAQTAGFRLILLTNQSGLGRGYYSRDEFAAVQKRVDALLAADDVYLDGVYYCPHAPDADCHCRKPRPGLLQAAARHFAWEPARAWMVGDKISDVLLARHAGLDALLVRTGKGNLAARDLDPAWRVPVVADLARAVDRILREAKA
ncbi:MAG: lipopolysaccharide heptosyltransferase II [bacterium]|nr:lipopolysaccharide heptosyltransferase II [bacterium]